MSIYSDQPTEYRNAKRGTLVTIKTLYEQHA